MNRTQIRQLAELAKATADAALMTRALDLLLAEMDKPAAMPLFQQPAMRVVDEAPLAAALDNLPPAVEAKPQPGRMTRKQLAVAIAEEWTRLFGDSWMRNTDAFGAKRKPNTERLRDLVLDLVDADEETSAREIGKRLWDRMRAHHPVGFDMQTKERQPVSSDVGYPIQLHRIVRWGAF